MNDNNNLRKCNRCGRLVKSGRYCPACVQEMAEGMLALFRVEEQEEVRRRPAVDMRGRMHFLNRAMQ